MTQIPPGSIYGDGSDGVKTVSGTETLNVYKSCSGTATDDHVDVASGDEGSFSAGDLVMLHKTRGNTTTDAGVWELLKVLSTADTLVTFTTNLVNSYQDAGNEQSQIILVPQYTTFSCPSSQTLAGTDWAGNLGGVVAICAKTSITIGGTVDADDLGYRGGTGSTVQNGQQGGGTPNESFSRLYTANANGGGGGRGLGGGAAGGGGGGLGTAGDNGFGSIQSGFLEKSNVQMVTELVNLITAQRAYEVCSRAIKAGDEMLQTSIDIARY